MIAKAFVEKYGQELIGKQVVTQAVGAYPGGIATVVQLNPDPAAPELVLNVEDCYGKSVIGIFEDEEISHVDGVTQSVYVPPGHVIWLLPKSAADTIMETLSMDADSGSFEQELRDEISAAMNSIQVVQ